MVGGPHGADADEGGAPVVLLFGDSLMKGVPSQPPLLRINHRDGRTVALSSGSLASAVANSSPDVVVIALGSNDVAQDRTRAQMEGDLLRALGRVEEVPCVVLTTVSAFGTPFYNPRWTSAANRFNRLVFSQGVAVVNWNRAVRENPTFLLPDGLHLTDGGREAYLGLILTRVAEAC